LSLLKTKILYKKKKKKFKQKWQTKFGQYEKLLWAMGPNFGGEVIVSVQCV